MNFKILMRKILSLIFIGILLVPTVTWILDLDFGIPVHHIGLKPPRMHIRAILDDHYYKAFDQYYNDSFVLRSPLIFSKRWMDFHIFRMTDAPDVHVGKQGWLYNRRSIENSHKEACGNQADAEHMALKLYALEKIIEVSGRRFFFMLAPNKSTIYPEFVGSALRSDACNQSRYDLLLDAMGVLPLKSLVRVDQLLWDAKSNQALLYDKVGVGWNGLGALVAARALQKKVFEEPREEVELDFTPVKSGENSGDLSRQLMGIKSSTGDYLFKQYAGTGRPRHPIGIVYGDDFIRRLLPYLKQMLSRLDVIQADGIPSRHFGEDLRSYELVLLERAEFELDLLAIDIDSLLSMFENEVRIAAKYPIDLQATEAVTDISLNLSVSGLEIKSVGEQSVFKITSLPVSDKNIFRLLKLSIDAPHSDIMTVRYMTVHPFNSQKDLKKGISEVYLPLPFQKSQSIQIQPGSQPGVFNLRSVEILEISSNADVEELHPQYLSDADTDLEENFSLLNSETESDLEPGTSNSEPQSIAKTVSIAVTDFEDGRIFQRNGRSADIVVSGIYTGQPGAIEARVVRDQNSDVVVSWTVVDASPQNGIYVGVIPNVPQGGWYNLQVRTARNREVMSRGTHKWGVGILVACLGQSNMKEWFYTGTDLKSHALLRKYDANNWSKLGRQGNAAIAFGNRIIKRLNIPVGFLDFSVNGSGLRKEADWGTGYWEDTARGSIYSQFVAGVSKTGGAVEFVVWIQGEADAARGTVIAEDYQTSLEHFITKQVRLDIENGSHRKHLPFLVVAMVKRPGGKDEPHQAIRNAQYQVVEKIPDCYLAATTLDLKNQGRQHLSTGAYLKMGNRVAQSVLYIMGEETYHRGPAIAGAKQIDPRTIDVRVEHRGGTSITPVSEMTGWEVLANGISVPLAKVFRHDPQTIRIVLERPLVQKARIRYLYGAMPDTTRSVLDNSAMSLPLEEGQTEVN
jgi:hypothetical protein